MSEARAGVYTLTEAATRLRMGRSTLYRLVKAGKVSYRLMPSGIRMTDADIDEYLDDIRRPAAA